LQVAFAVVIATSVLQMDRNAQYCVLSMDLLPRLYLMYIGPEHSTQIAVFIQTTECRSGIHSCDVATLCCLLPADVIHCGRAAEAFAALLRAYCCLLIACMIWYACGLLCPAGALLTAGKQSYFVALLINCLKPRCHY
jgi:hypothetical protein